MFAGRCHQAVRYLTSTVLLVAAGWLLRPNASPYPLPVPPPFTSHTATGAAGGTGHRYASADFDSLRNGERACSGACSALPV